MTLPTESIGSFLRPPALLEGIEQFRLGKLSQVKLDTLCGDVLKHTIACLEATGSPVVSEGEQTKSSFVNYPVGYSE